jgi:urease accessory protein
MVARAALAVELARGHAGRMVSQVRVLRSHAPLVLRPTLPKACPMPICRTAGAAHVSLASGAAGPLGGDDFQLDVRVGRGSTLVLSDISATLLLPGARGGQSRMRIAVTVEDDAAFVWLSEPVIAAQGCDHIHDIDVVLAPGARLFMRDELLLGRHKEQPGRLRQRIHVTRGGEPLLVQQLDVGAGVRGWQSPAVLGNRKCVGMALVVDPAWRGRRPDAAVLGNDAALLPLEGPAAMISALAGDMLALGRILDRGMARLGYPWTEDEAASAGLADTEDEEGEEDRLLEA